MTQNEQIKQWLLQGHPISAASALARFGCARLAARINDLRNSGMVIDSWPVKSHGKRWAMYQAGKRGLPVVS